MNTNCITRNKFFNYFVKFIALFFIAALLVTVVEDLSIKAAASKPGKVKLSKVTASGNKLVVKFKKVSGADGYEINVSTSSKLKKAESYSLEQGKKSTITYTVSDLKAGKYYVRVRAYKHDGSGVVYGSWSKKKNATIKTSSSKTVIEADFVNDYDNYGLANAGIIPVQKDGLWGTVNYNGETITPCKYDIFWYAPDDNGRTVFKNYDGTYFLVDNKGKVVYSGTDEVMSSGGYYIVNKLSDDAEYAPFDAIASQDYYNASGKLVISNEINGDPARLNGFIDGTSTSKTLRIETGVDGREYYFLNYVNVTSSGKTKALKNDDEDNYNKQNEAEMKIDHSHDVYAGAGGSGERYTLGSENGGYYMTSGPNTTDITIWSSDGKCINILPLFEGDEDCYSWPNAFFIDGSWQFNLGSLIVIKNCSFMDGSYSQCVLVDFSKLGNQNFTYIEDLPKKAVLYTGAYVGINTEKYWLATKDYSTWEYIDHTGKVVKTYDDATDFYNGYAMVNDNGNEYLIDENFNVVKELGKANGASCALSIFRVDRTDGSYDYYIVK